MVKMTFRTDERDQIRKLIEQYGCSPFSGKCHVDEVSFQKVGKTYHIILTEEQIQKFNILDDYMFETDSIHQYLVMIKPTAEDNNYLFFRRV